MEQKQRKAAEISGSGEESKKAPEKKKPKKLVKFQHAIHSITLNAAGMSIAEVRNELGAILHIGNDATPVVDGNEVSENYIIDHEVENVQFVKRSSDKGCSK